MLCGEVHPFGNFRFVNFGHPPPLVFRREVHVKRRGAVTLAKGERTAQHDVVDLTLPGREFPARRKRAGDVGCVHRVFARRVDHHHVACLDRARILGVVQHGGIEARAHDGRIRWALATLLEFFETLAIDASVVRTAMSRLTADGWFERSKIGRNSFYRLVQRGRLTFDIANRTANFDNRNIGTF